MLESVIEVGLQQEKDEGILFISFRGIQGNAVYFLFPLSPHHQGQIVQGNVLSFFDLRVCRNLNPTLPEGRHCTSGPSGICLHDQSSKRDVVGGVL